jgi:hypothetical protein
MTKPNQELILIKKLMLNICLLTGLGFISGSCKNQHVIEKHNEWDQINFGEYLIENNTWNIAQTKSQWTQTIFCDTIHGTMGWRWDFTGEKDKPNTFLIKTFPEIIYGRKPYDGYESTTSRLPAKLASAQFKLEYDYSAKGSGVYNTSTDLSFTDSPISGPSNIRAKMMIWFDRQDFPFFENEKLKQAEIGENQYQVFIDTTHTGPEGKWAYIALLPEKFPLQGVLNFNDFFDYLLSEGALKPEWYLSSIEIGSEISSGKGEVVFKKFVVR